MKPGQSGILPGISGTAAADTHYSSLLRKARECAEIYLLVAGRQKGCDGMGEFAMIREEFREAVDDLVNYCKRKEYLPGDCQYDLDTMAKEISVPP